MASMKRKDFAARHGVSKSTVSRWEKRGLVVVAGGLVDIETSEDRLRAAGVETALLKADSGNPEASSLDAFLQGLMRGQFASQAEAERVKQNALAGLRVLEWRRKSGELVELELAERVLFESSREIRDSWLNWPARVAPLIAADLGIDADRLTAALDAAVYDHLAELGEPEAEFVDPEKCG